MHAGRQKLFHIPRIPHVDAAFQQGASVHIDGHAMNQSTVDVLNYQLMLDLGAGKGQQGLINALYHDKNFVGSKMTNWPDVMLEVLLKTTRRYAELVFESVRVANFPEMPSRQYCIYLSEAKDVAKWYAAISPGHNAAICEVEADHGKRILSL